MSQMEKEKTFLGKHSSIRIDDKTWREIGLIADEITASTRKRMTKNNLVVVILKKFISEWRNK